MASPCAEMTSDGLMRGLDEAHMIIWGADSSQRQHALTLCREMLSAIPETQTVELNGASMIDIKSARAALAASLPGPIEREPGPSFDGPSGVLARLREPPPPIGGAHIKRRYYLWHDADVLLTSSPASFSVMIDAIAGVAAESEYASDDLLLIQRLVLIGSPDLATCYADEHGPLRSWRHTSPWAKQTKIAAPVFSVLRAC